MFVIKVLPDSHVKVVMLGTLVHHAKHVHTVNTETVMDRVPMVGTARVSAVRDGEERIVKNALLDILVEIVNRALDT